MEKLSHETKPLSKHEKELHEKELQRKHNFYSIKFDGNGSFKGLYMKKANIVEKLKEMNFFRYDIDPETSRFVFIKNGLVTEVSKEVITDNFVNYVNALDHYNYDNGTETIMTITPKMIIEALFEKLTEYFSKALLFRLTPQKPIIMKIDTKTEKFFYYKNGFVTVTKDGYKLNDYKYLEKNIWSNQRLNRAFKVDKKTSVFEQFLSRICSVKANNEYTPDPDRLKCLKTIIGYNLHGFFNYQLKATILTDSRLSDDDEPNGRTGKTLFAKALGKMLNYDDISQVYCEINGKDFNSREKHRYSKACMETQLININDLSRNMPFEIFFNDITEGVTIDKKNEKPFSIKAKLILSTNRTIQIQGESAKDRAIQFEFSDYYDSNRSPATDFKHWFFTDWDENEWNRFDTFMISCVEDFFKYGLLEAKSINLHLRTLIDHSTHEFVDFMTDFFKEGKTFYYQEIVGNLQPVEVKLIYNDKINKNDLYQAFCDNYKDFSPKTFKQRTFTKWLRAYCKHTKGLEELSKQRNTEGRSNGLDWIIFKKIETN